MGRIARCGQAADEGRCPIADDQEKPKRPPQDNHDPMPVTEVPEDERDERIHRGRIHEDIRGGTP
jgi:hypothetical protein